MLFSSPLKKPTIRQAKGHPVAVIAAFNTVGDMMPRYFCIEDDNEELFKYQISSVKQIKEQHMVRSFYCTYDAYGYRNTILLHYNITSCRWVVG